MRIIAFVTQKGGAGKSTLACNLAVTAKLAGERVVILDLDPLQTLVKWAKLRQDDSLPVEAVPAHKLRSALEAIEKIGATLVVLDAPGQDGVAQDAAIEAADFVVIPCRPNAFDLWASELTRVKVKAKGGEYSFLLNQCPPAQQSLRVDQGAKALQAMGGLLSPLVSARVDFQEAARQGLGVAEWRPLSPATDEMRELWSSVKRRMKKQAVAARSEKPVAKGEPKSAKPISSLATEELEPTNPSTAVSALEPKAAAKTASPGKGAAKGDGKTQHKADQKAVKGEAGATPAAAATPSAETEKPAAKANVSKAA
jgi:chromosome partitioning protein